MITEAGNHPKVSSLVYITAFAPDAGESVSSLIANPPPGAPVPPVNTPPPSTVGWVDQSQVDALDSFKAAQDQFVKYGQDQQRATQDKLKGAKTQDDRNKIMVDYKKIDR